jgi:hypothetical protein
VFPGEAVAEVGCGLTVKTKVSCDVTKYRGDFDWWKRVNQNSLSPKDMLVEG